MSAVIQEERKPRTSAQYRAEIDMMLEEMRLSNTEAALRRKEGTIVDARITANIDSADRNLQEINRLMTKLAEAR